VVERLDKRFGEAAEALDQTWPADKNRARRSRRPGSLPLDQTRDGAIDLRHLDGLGCHGSGSHRRHGRGKMFLT
jgi:hypothetical protein